MTTKYTDGAVRAATRMWDNEKSHGILMDRAEYIKVLSAYIDQETAAERDGLRRALKDARAKLVFPFVAHDAENAVRIIDAALDGK